MNYPAPDPMILYPTRLPHEDIERLKALAFAKRTRPATLARVAIQAYLEQQIKTPEANALGFKSL